MKSFLGLKAKASTLVKEKMEQAKSRPGSAPAIQKPFEDPQPSGRDGKEAEQSPRSRSSSPSKKRLAQQPILDGNGDIDPVIEHLLQNARSKAVKEEFLQTPPEEYTTAHNLKLLVGSYNVNGRMPDSNLDLKPWLDAAGVGADIVAVAFQEIVPLNAQNVVIGARLEAASAWDILIEAALNGTDREDGHLVMKAHGWKGAESGVVRGQDAGHSTRTPSPSPSPNPKESTAEASSPIDGELELAAQPSGGAEAALTDHEDLEGYLSPAEDTFSIFSDEQPGLKPYAQLVGKQMVGVYLSIWVRRALLRQIRGVQVTTIGTGIMGYLGNKGAVAARLRIFDSGLTIVAAHLSSGEQEGDELKRNYDYTEIVRRGQFPPDTPTLEPDGLSTAQPGPPDVKIAGLGRAPGQWGRLKGLLDSSHVVWMGDLNYRLTMPDAEARAAIKSGSLAKAAAHDELKNMMKQQRAFQGWEEGPLNFPPTFKFKRGSHAYLGDDEEEAEAPDASSLSASSTSPSISGNSPSPQTGAKSDPEQKSRKPAWTDRILWRPHVGIKQLSYTSANMTASDHKPVVATFGITAKEYLRGKVEAALDTARRTVDAREMASMPRCDLEPLAVDAGVVRYAEQVVVHLILRNTGVVPASWQFASLPGSMFSDPQDQALRRCPRWARVTPDQGELQPGEAVEILLSIWVDGGQEGAAALLTTVDARKLDAILVLRVEEGNDIFCSVTGTYEPSFFGLPLTLLAALPRPLVAADGWDSGSPKLRINTQKKPRQRNLHGSDGPPSDFYSPLSSFHNSPLAEVDLASARDNREKAHRKVGSRSSIGSIGELEAFSPAHSEALLESHASADAPTAAAGREAGLSSVDDMVQAFGTLVPDTVADASEQHHRRVASGAAAEALSHASEPAGRGSGGAAGLANVLLPPELAALTGYLYEKGRLQTPGLFIFSVDMAHAVSPRSPSSAPPREQGAAVTNIRKSLDRGHGVPEGSSAQQVAATILAFFCALPAPFMPAAASQVCSATVPSKTAASALLADALSPAEFAIFQNLIDLMVKILEPGNAAKNGVTIEPLANLFAEVWFERLPLGFKASSQDLRAEGVTELQKLADGVSQVAERRSQFIAGFLQP